ncbi:hypothetical protein GCM10027448_28470 [Nocardioides dilutus]
MRFGSRGPRRAVNRFQIRGALSSSEPGSCAAPYDESISGGAMTRAARTHALQRNALVQAEQARPAAGQDHCDRDVAQELAQIPG